MFPPDRPSRFNSAPAALDQELVGGGGTGGAQERIKRRGAAPLQIVFVLAHEIPEALDIGGAEPLGARQIIRLRVERVQTSCGYGVPLFDYRAERDQLDRWAASKGPEGIEAYWHEKNEASMDGLPTGLFDPL